VKAFLAEMQLFIKKMAFGYWIFPAFKQQGNLKAAIFYPEVELFIISQD
jgi:hypothetical protein